MQKQLQNHEKDTILRRKTSLQKAFCNNLPAQKGANIGLDNQNKQGKDKTHPKINKNKQPYVGNPACKKHSVTNCQPKGRCSNKLVEKTSNQCKQNGNSRCRTCQQCILTLATLTRSVHNCTTHGQIFLQTCNLQTQRNSA